MPWRALRRIRRGLALAALALLAACSGAGPEPARAPDTATPASAPALAGGGEHVGRAVCGSCHPAQLAAWQGSHHDLSMQPADADSVLGDFDGARFEYAGITSVFSRRGGRYFVRTDGPDGKLADFEIRYTFGHHPLQQYLIELPGGRLQAFGIAWDSRPKAVGGQRWFHLYPDRQLGAGDPLHWTGQNQNWNFMCAECHSTGLVKNYDAASNTYATRWAEIDVSCEACHGPGQAHVRWANQPPAAQVAAPDKALAVTFDERRGVHWQAQPETGNSLRSRPRTTRIEIDACGRCHGRASRLVGGAAHGGSLLDTHRPALLDPDQYWPDGQMRGEVFNWGPFLQSRMQGAGVTCSDCHEPHALQLRAAGNALCAQCHLSQHYEQAAHTHHAAGSAGSRCVACHLPTTTFMQVDVRHDHGFRVPRPDLSQRLGTPNACNACHDEHDAAWAAEQIVRWFPDSRHRQDSFADVLQAAREGHAGAAGKLVRLAADDGEPAIVRATALREMATSPNAAAIRQAEASLKDADPLVRMAAVEVLGQTEPRQRAALLGDALADPVQGIRMDAAAALAGPAEAALDPRQTTDFQHALAEYTAALELNADRADAVVSHGELVLHRGDPAAAARQFRRALELDPEHVPARLGLAAAERARGDEAAAAAALERGVERMPQSAELQHALGLAWVRAGRRDDAIARLARAAELAPDVPRYAYVLGVALHDQGKRERACEVLEHAVQRHANDRELLNVLALYEFEAGRRDRARELAKRLVELDPDDAGARQTLQWVQR